VHKFQDCRYNRTSFSLVGSDIVDEALKFCKKAFELVNFDEHRGYHPSLGAIDHILFSPLGDTPLFDLGETSRIFAEKLNQLENVTIFCYGQASTNNLALKHIRKELGYFDSRLIRTEDGLYFGSAILSRYLLFPLESIIPDFGSMASIDPKKGVTCVGAADLITNFNVRFCESNSRTLVNLVTNHIRSPEVEAMTLRHENGSFECACNLLKPNIVSPDVVLQRVQDYARVVGATVEHSYTTGMSGDHMLALFENWEENDS